MFWIQPSAGWTFSFLLNNDILLNILTGIYFINHFFPIRIWCVLKLFLLCSCTYSLKTVNAHWVKYFFSCQVQPVFLWQWIITCSGALILHIWCCVRLKDQHHSFLSEFVPVCRLRGVSNNILFWVMKAVGRVKAEPRSRSYPLPISGLSAFLWECSPKTVGNELASNRILILPVCMHRENKNVFWCYLPYLAWRVCSGLPWFCNSGCQTTSGCATVLCLITMLLLPWCYGHHWGGK